MPRITRAAVRANPTLDDIAASVPLPASPYGGGGGGGRKILGEISANQEDVTTSSDTIVSTAAKKPSAKTKKAKGGKKSKKRDAGQNDENREVLEDENQSGASSAVEDACEELLKDRSKGANPIYFRDQRPATPESSAVEAATKALSPKKMHPVNLELDPTMEKETQNTLSEKEDSFVEVIHTRSPVKSSPVKMELFNEVTEAVSTPAPEPANDKKFLKPTEDSFVEQIITRSPLPPKRIEDSVEAIDDLEDAIDQIDAALTGPAAPIKLAKTRKSRVKPEAPSRTSPRKATKTIAPTKPSTKPTTSTTQKASSTRRSTAPLSTSKPPSIRPRLSTRPSSTKLSAAKASPPSTSQPPVAITAPKPRPASLSKPPFVPQKSSKPPTKSTFTLPGDAISQKLKEQREARLQAEEAQAAEKKTFKARPVRLSSAAPVVRMTNASRARVSMSVANGTTLGKDDAGMRRGSAFIGNLGDKENRISSMSSTKANVGGGGTVAETPSEGVAKRQSVVARPTASAPKSKKASATRPRTSSLTTHTATVSPSGAPSTTTTTSSSDAPRSMSGLTVVPTVGKSRGKEVYARGREGVEALERAKREKEEAAKKARAEAAERGRKASREWAERMKAKKAGASVGT